jgi:nucleoside-diphosphate-sugar epimerase
MVKRGSKVFVTGATGFIGSRLVKTLVQQYGCEVTVLVRDFSKLSSLSRYPLNIIAGGLDDEKALAEGAKNTDIVFNLGSAMDGSTEYFQHINVASLGRFLEISKQNGVQKFVHTSTISVYGYPKSGIINENRERQYGNGDYADTKLDGEKLVVDFAKQNDFQANVIQPTIVYGPFGGCWTVARLLGFPKNRVILVDGGDGICSAVYVDDIVDGMIALANIDNICGECFLISGEEKVTWKEFFGYYSEMLGGTEFIEMSKEEALEYYQNTQRVPSTIAQLKDLFRDQELRHKIRDLPLVKIPYQFVKKCLPRKLSDSVIGQVVDHSEAFSVTNQPQEVEKPIWILIPEEVSLYASKAEVSFLKAKNTLGYTPNYNLKEGMEKTFKWASWARII